MKVLIGHSSNKAGECMFIQQRKGFEIRSYLGPKGAVLQTKPPAEC